MGAGVAGVRLGDVGHERDFKVSRIVDAGKVIAGVVGPTHKGAPRVDRIIGDDQHAVSLQRLSYPQANGRSIARHAANRQNILVLGRAQFTATDGIEQLGFVDFQIASDEHKEELALYAVRGVAVVDVEHSLERFIGGHA